MEYVIVLADAIMASRSESSFARRQPPIHRYLTRHSYSYNPIHIFRHEHDLTDFCICVHQLYGQHPSDQAYYSAKRQNMQFSLDI